MGARRGSRLDRLLRCTREDPVTGCWLWMGNLSTAGYGRLSTAGVTELVHRISYMEFIGEIPKGLHLDHLCQVRNCVNPWHLEPVSLAENNRRTLERGTHAHANKTHCKRGHPYSEENTRYATNGRWRICITCYHQVDKRRRDRDKERYARQ